MKRPIKKGDWFLLPYRGKRIDLLIRAVTRDCYVYWNKIPGNGRDLHYFLGSCRRISPSVAKRIIEQHKRARKSK